jgi:hypothetical protein
MDALFHVGVLSLYSVLNHLLFQPLFRTSPQMSGARCTHGPFESGQPSTISVGVALEEAAARFGAAGAIGNSPVSPLIDSLFG